MYKYEYMNPVTVQSAAAGGIIDESGRFLRMAGSIHVKPGDTVWTDGNIVYGHSPTKEKAALPTRRSGIPYHGYDASYRDGQRQLPYGAFKKSGGIYPYNFVQNAAYMKSLNYLTTWMYTYNNKVYGYVEGNPRTDLCSYLDIKVDGNKVFTAEYDINDASFHGKAPEPPVGVELRQLQTFIANFYFYHNDEASSAENPVFELRYHSTGGKVYSNPVISIKRNGVESETITLSDYQFALNKLKEIYLDYDESGDSEITKRYHFEGKVEGQRVPGCDIWCSYLFNQVLNFTFTDNVGIWEMILLSAVEGVVLPHTVDNEYNYSTEEYEDVYSDYHIACPVIYYVVRIRSNGSQEILHERVCVKSFDDNAVEKSTWTNAQAVEVTEIDRKNEPYFTINFGDCSMTTNLKTVSQISDAEGNSVAGGDMLFGFRRFTMSNPAQAKPIGAINSFIVEDLKNGTSSVSVTSGQHIGYDSSNVWPSLVKGYYQPPIIRYARPAAAYFGRVSLYKCQDGSYIISIKNQGIFKDDNPDFPVSIISSNINVDVVNNLRNLKNIRTMADLIADMADSNNG